VRVSLVCFGFPPSPAGGRRAGDEGVSIPDKMLIVVARSDEATFGILPSRFHELWALRLGTGLEDRPRYTHVFETFPFPAGLTPADDVSLPPLQGEGAKARIATAAQALNQLRENWLNPPEWADWARTPEEEKAGYPARPVAKAYGWNDYTPEMPDEEILRRLLALNLERLS